MPPRTEHGPDRKAQNLAKFSSGTGSNFLPQSQKIPTLPKPTRPTRGSCPRDTHVTRRQLLGGMTAVGATAALGVMGSGTAAAAGDGPRVVIVGAGLAGLSCTHRLRKHGIKATLYEPQDRLGGRCWSIVDFFENGQTAEHGGQYVDSRHTQLRSLAAELGVELVDTFAQDIPSGSQSYRWVKGDLRTSDEVFADFGVFFQRLKRAYERAGDYHWNTAGEYAKRFDQMSVVEYLDKVLDGARTRYWKGASKLVSKVSSVWSRRKCLLSIFLRRMWLPTRGRMSASASLGVTASWPMRLLPPFQTAQ